MQLGLVRESFSLTLFCCFPGFTKWLNFVLTPPDVTDSTVQADASRGSFTVYSSLLYSTEPENYKPGIGLFESLSEYVFTL